VSTTGVVFQRILKRVRAAASSSSARAPTTAPVNVFTEAQGIIKKARAWFARRGSNLDIGVAPCEPLSKADAPATATAHENEPGNGQHGKAGAEANAMDEDTAAHEHEHMTVQSSGQMFDGSRHAQADVSGSSPQPACDVEGAQHIAKKSRPVCGGPTSASGSVADGATSVQDSEPSVALQNFRKDDSWIRQSACDDKTCTPARSHSCAISEFTNLWRRSKLALKILARKMAMWLVLKLARDG
jgi:hypothetical protein